MNRPPKPSKSDYFFPGTTIPAPPTAAIARGPRIPRSLSSLLSGAAILAVPAVAAFLAIRALAPPAPLSADAPSTEFSAHRAAMLLNLIAAEPHPLGTPAHDAVRDGVLGMWRGLGLSPELHSGTYVDTDSHYAARVENIVVRLPGRSRSSGRSLLLAAHYDSVESAPGASDDAVGVVTLLETARALLSGPPLAEDAVFLVTDGEEDGMIGARVFRDQHPWARDIGLALNFEARGTTGPSLMYETSPGNNRLISALAATPHPRAFSFSAAVYRRMPNNGDLTVFMQGGMQGLNFAYIDRAYDYHSPNDNLAHVDFRSLQHHGSYALALARRFGDAGVPHRAGTGEVYFSLFGDIFVHYSTPVALALAGLAVSLLVAAWAAAALRRRLRVGGAALGMAFFAGSVILAAGLGYGLLAAVAASHGSWLRAGPYRYNHFYALALILLAADATAFVYGRVRTRARGLETAFGTAIVWVVLAVLGALTFPEASYFVGLPALLLAATLLVWALRRGAVHAVYADRNVDLLPGPVSALGSAVVAALLAAPVIFLFFLAMFLTPVSAAVLGAVTALIVTAAAPAVELLHRRLGKALPAALLVLFAGFAVASVATTRYTERTPRWVSLSYLADCDKGQAYWVARGRDVFPWTEEIAGGKFTPGHPRPEHAGRPELYAYREAPMTADAPPEVGTVEDRVDGTMRMLRLRVSSPRGGRRFVIQCTGENIAAAALEGKALELRSPKGFGAVFLNPGREGFEVALETEAGAPVTIKVRESNPGLPVLPGFVPPPPPPGLGLSRVDTILSRTFVFD